VTELGQQKHPQDATETVEILLERGFAGVMVPIMPNPLKGVNAIYCSQVMINIVC
jgi:hypothetical protein